MTAKLRIRGHKAVYFSALAAVLVFIEVTLRLINYKNLSELYKLDAKLIYRLAPIWVGIKLSRRMMSTTIHHIFRLWLS